VKIPQWLINIVAKKAGEEIFKEDSMDGSKKWYQSKTNIAAIVGFLFSLYQIFAMLVAPIFGITLPPIPEWAITAIGAVVGPVIIYGRNTATKTIG
jgi:hypothetical protein